ncbi:ANTAR domain-containing protein [Streptomyces sp. NPDC048442]|uniref:ANTAR domain-containing protein n=1 Tax=Streptomyces sp. NPDC048442 TaxID=3154823 RepID=UPI0034157CF8
MAVYRHGELTALIDSLNPDGPGPSPRWTAHCAELLDLDGVSVSTRSHSSELLWYSNELSARLDDLQFTLGEGPSVESTRDGALCLVTDVRRTPHTCWPAFVPAATELGVQSVFAFPLRLGAIRVGSMTGHRREARGLSEECVDAALRICDALTVFLLSAVRPHDREPPYDGGAAPVPVGGGHPGGHPGERPSGHPGGHPGGLHRAVVHQATGMLSVDLGVELTTALDRLRAYAFAQDRPIVSVSRDIVARRLRLPDDRPRPRPRGGRGGD